MLKTSIQYLLNKTIIMTNIKNLYILVFSLLITTISNAQELEKVNTGALGDVKYSILNPEQFAMVNGDGWILLDGRKLSSKSDLYKLLNKTGHSNIIPDDKLPNGDGVFIRGVDTDEADSYGEIEKNRIVGTYQDDSFKSHSHVYNNDNYDHRAGKGNSNANVQKSQGGINTGNTATTGSVETRPKNIALYIYIKIYKN